MNKSKKLSIVFSAFLTVYFGEIAINIACGPEPDPYDYYVSFFHNDTPGDEYIPFSFTGMQFLYDENEPESEAEINGREWVSYLGQKTKAKDVVTVMYRTNSVTDDRIAQYLKGLSDLPDSLKSNTFIEGLKNKPIAKDYYLFAKKVEPHATTTYSYWDPEPQDADRMLGLAEMALETARNTQQDKFIQGRYAYQAARMYHFAEYYEECVEVYEELISNIQQSTAMKGWALSLKAGAIRRLGDPLEAAYLFAKVFESNPERRVQAYKNFHYIDVPIEEVIAETAVAEEKAILWAIDGFNNADYDLKTLKTVYELAPKNPMVGVLLTREVNKLETYLTETSMYYNAYGGTYYHGNDAVQENTRQYAYEIIEFSQLLTKDKHYPQRPLASLAKAYVHWLLHEDVEAKQLLATLNPKKLSERLADQYRIIELLLTARSLQESNDVEIASMVASLTWLDSKRSQELAATIAEFGPENYYWQGEINLRFTRTATNLYQSVLAPHFLSLGDTATAAVLMVKGDRPTLNSTENGGFLRRASWSTTQFWQEQLQPQALETLGKWAREGMPGPWTMLCKDVLNELISDDYWDLLGTSYLRMHDYASAIESFKQLSSAFNQPNPTNWYSDTDEDTLYANPFSYTINDYPKAFGTKDISKIEFAQQMLDFQNRIKAGDKDAAKIYFQMANGVYQTGSYGSSWQFISYAWSSSDNYVKGNYYYSRDYNDARQAALWYEKARSLSTSKEFKALCTFMLAKCEQKLYGYENLTDYYVNGYSLYDKAHPFWVFSQGNRYFKELHIEYQDTDFFKQAVHECSYLSDFIIDTPSLER